MATVSIAQAGVGRRDADAAVVTSLWPLFPILCVQLVVSLLTLHNTAFQDEGLYLYAGRQIVQHWMGGPAPLDHYAFYFSGYPHVYPVIGGFLDLTGGLALARSFSLACMLGVTALVYVVTEKLFERPAAVFAAAAYASTGVVLFLGRLATYDAMCLFLVALAAAIAVHAGASKRPWSALAIGPVLVLAILTKYAALLFVLPVLGLLACGSVALLSWRSAVVRLALALMTFAVCLAVAHQVVDKAAFHAIAGSTTSRAVGLKAPPLTLLTHVLQMGGVGYGFAFAGLILRILHRQRLSVLAAVLFAGSLLAPAYHIYKHEPISLDKHIAFGLFFAMPLTGYALAWLSGYVRRPLLSSHRGYWLAGAAVVTVVLALGLRQSHALYSNWADTSALSYALHTQVRPSSGRIFVEDIEVARYDLRDTTKEWQWNSLYYPYYIDAAHHHWFGDPALIHAVKDRYYDLIELSFNYFPGQAYFLAQQLAVTKNYDLIGVIPFVNSYGRGHYYLWRSALAAGHGDFTSVAQLKTNVWCNAVARC
jgi:4-amino-4-deoxy-L-arabinose transferase-like glycosyltransferase